MGRCQFVNLKKEGWMATLVPNSFPASNPASTRFTKRATSSMIYLLPFLRATTALKAVATSATRPSISPYNTTSASTPHTGLP